ncbi:PREDICTED: uncharacterized protein LOC104809445 [Tarenaya hassleriana]|uniref:uncharacterized protein LOC104809445 n=1 Tax=Tarenaya hassleriana TaxID=28532 RepID=UPI00053C2383|nr:PREDICTED: uncharacterized protein LOC104809445 [Tarenaya hassleriana]
MKLVWSPETASKAYIDTVRSCENLGTPGAAELVAAMAAGWNAKLIVETWSEGEDITLSLGLTVASHHTNAKHICIVPNAKSQAVYLQAIQESVFSSNAPEIIVTEEPEKAMKKLQEVDFLVVDWRHKESAMGVLRNAAFRSRGAVVICRSGYSRTALGFSWRRAFGDRKVVKTVILPVAGGLDIAHVAAADSEKSDDNNKRRWIKHIDLRSGEEHVIRK